METGEKYSKRYVKREPFDWGQFAIKHTKPQESLFKSLTYSGALAREAQAAPGGGGGGSGAPWVRKCGKLPIQENLAVT